jgi:sugar/nucleoside kinase (ribokinase family)
MACDAYLYGMILKTNSFLLKGEYPKADTYGEILQRYALPGGETGTCATVLCALGRSVKMDGTYMGRITMPFMRDFYAGMKCDLSSLHEDDTFDGLEDHVLVAGNTRTPLGEFQAYFSSPVKRWNAPKEADVSGCKAAGIDPFFGEASLLAAELCRKHGKPYVTIDCAYDSPLHCHSAVNVVSDEFYRDHYAGQAREEVLKRYMEASEGLTIFTLGAREIRFGRKGGEIRSFTPYPVEVVSTLGAGDTFKAGCVYALWAGMDDISTVRFAAACAAVACTRFPLPLNPPRLHEVLALMAVR